MDYTAKCIFHETRLHKPSLNRVKMVISYCLKVAWFTYCSTYSRVAIIIFCSYVPSILIDRLIQFFTFRYLWYTKKQDFTSKNSNTTSLTPLANSTDSTNSSAIETAIDVEAKKLLGDELVSADSEKEIQHWFIISIVVSVVAVRIKIC